MSKNNNSGTRSGVSFMSLLQLTFIILKLCNVITWSWWLVLIPIWVELVLCIGLIAFAIWVNKK